jgi:pimeloyl-ACP methyl ester carboxylesterase
VLLIHGAHFQGIHEPRIQEFARALASAGLRVITPHLEEITHHNVTPGTLDTIQQIARLAARRTHYETVGVIGVSFSGSLALLAAAQEQPAAGATKVIANVAAVGSYVSIAHLGRWYAGLDAIGPEQQVLPFKPHPYGARVLFQAHADTVFGEHAAEVKRALAFYISDQPERALAFAETLPEPPRSEVLELVSDVPHPLSAKLLALLEEHKTELAAISPEGQLAKLNVPVLLVHGSDDPIVASTETLWLEREVPRHALRQSLVTSAIRHAELEAKPSVAELWALVQWASALLEVNEKQVRTPLVQ